TLLQGMCRFRRAIGASGPSVCRNSCALARMRRRASSDLPSINLNLAPSRGRMSVSMTLAMESGRTGSIDWYHANRRRSRDLFDVARPAAYYDRPIPLRNPICFYEGHLPAFSVNTLIKRALKEPGVDEEYELLFERGIDPEDEAAAGNGRMRWPSRDRILD